VKMKVYGPCSSTSVALSHVILIKRLKIKVKSQT